MWCRVGVNIWVGGQPGPLLSAGWRALARGWVDTECGRSRAASAGVSTSGMVTPGRVGRYPSSREVLQVIDPVRGPARFAVRVLDVGTAPVRGLARLGSDSLLAALLALLGVAHPKRPPTCLRGQRENPRITSPRLQR